MFRLLFHFWFVPASIVSTICSTSLEECFVYSPVLVSTEAVVCHVKGVSFCSSHVNGVITIGEGKV